MSRPAERHAAELHALWEPTFEGSLTDWASSLALPQSTRASSFRPEEAPWLCEPADALLDACVRQVTFVGAAGSAKSLLGELYTAYAITNDSGLIYYTCQDDDSAKDVMEDRIVPMFVANRVLAEAMPVDRSKKRTAKIQFRGVTLYALGANKNNARSKRVKHLIREETHLWEPGMMGAFKKRVTAVAGAKILDLTTGAIKDDESDQEFSAGTMEERFCRCPACNGSQRPKISNLRFERNDQTIDAEGNFRWGPLRASVYYQCEHCPARWRDSEETRRALVAGSHYVQTNPNASGEHRSFRVSAILIHWISWGDLIQEWLTANRAAKMGSIELLKIFVMERLAEFWDDSPREEDPVAAGRRAGSYRLAEPWDDGWPEITRFLTADKQKDHLYYVVRAWTATGQSRLVHAAKVSTEEALEDARVKLGVEKPRTMIDCAKWTQEVQRRCVQYGWAGLWGSDEKSWAHDVKSPAHPKNRAFWLGQNPKLISDARVRLPFSPPQRGHASIGLKGKEEVCVYYYWSNPSIKDFWHALYNGAGAGWTYAENAPAEYRSQLNAEVKRQKAGRAGGQIAWEWTHGKRPNHYLDCEQMNLVAALMDPRIALAPSQPVAEEAAS